MKHDDPRQRYPRELRELPEWLQAETDDHHAAQPRETGALFVIACIVLAAFAGAAVAILENAGVL